MNDVAEPVVDAPEPEAISPWAALKVASFWLGCMSLVATVTLITSPLTGAAATVVSVIAMSFAVIGSPTWRDRRAWPHALAAILAALSVFGLCATKCGTYAYYENFLGLPTGIIAILLHGFIAMTLLIQVRRYPDHDLVGDVAIAIGIGGSLFYGSVLLAAETWCGACFAIHALMLVQFAELLANRRGLPRYAAVITAVAAAGLANVAYHHQPLPPMRNDANDLLTYMRSMWTSDAPPQRIIPTSEQAGEALRNAPAVLKQLAAPAGATIPELPQPQGEAARPADVLPGTSPVQRPRSVPADQPGALRTAADANRWGRREAPVALAFGSDLGCPVCAQQFSQVLELKDLVDAGKIQIRFLMSYKNDASQAMASLSYAAGLAGEQQLIDTLTAFYSQQREILTAADAVQHLPASFPSQQAISIVRGHKDDITALMTDAAKLKETLGSTGDPMLWYFAAGANRPAREFKGITMAPLLRLAANSMVQPP